MNQSTDPNPIFGKGNMTQTADPVHAVDEPWCRNSKGKDFGFDDFASRAKAFHGYAAPGLLLGGRMVALAYSRLPQDILFDAICETSKCLPDAVQMLTPCTVGNGWLTIFPLGKFALSLYDKQNGRGIRVCIDPSKLASWAEIDAWFFKKKEKPDQDGDRLVDEIRRSENALYRLEEIRVRPDLLTKNSVGPRRICPECGESYPETHGFACRSCSGSRKGSGFPLQQKTFLIYR